MIHSPKKHLFRHPWFLSMSFNGLCFCWGGSPCWFSKSGQDDPVALWRPMIFCVFLKLMEVLKIPSWERPLKGWPSCVSVKFVVHVWVGWWLMVPKGIVQFIGWSLFQDSVFLTSSLKVVIILVTVVRGRITLMPEFIWYMHLVWKDSPTQEYLVPVHSWIATCLHAQHNFLHWFQGGYNPWIFKPSWQLDQHLPYHSAFSGKIPRKLGGIYLSVPWVVPSGGHSIHLETKEALEHLLWELDVKQGPAGLIWQPFHVWQKGKTMFWGRLNFGGIFWGLSWSRFLFLDLKCDFQAFVVRKLWLSPFCLGVGTAETIYQ